MISIVQASEKDAALLSALAKKTFLESHGHSADPADIDRYVAEKYSDHILQEELGDRGNIYHILWYDKIPVGYSKIIFDLPYPGSSLKNITKLERIYLLKEFYNLDAGSALFQFNLALSKEHEQLGIWLYTWIENSRAIRFYLKKGFRIIGSHDFQISTTHSNPNHLMFLEF
ncbi:MAG: GNAT family N-acetyltransferase [Bacteroidota bacterium]